MYMNNVFSTNSKNKINFASKNYIMTKRRCEEFFDNDSNFDI